MHSLIKKHRNTPKPPLTWATMRHLPETRTIAIALVSLSAILIWYGILMFSHSPNAATMGKIITKHIVGGAAIGALTGAPDLDKAISDGPTMSKHFQTLPTVLNTPEGALPGIEPEKSFSTLENIILNSLITITLICLTYGIFSLSTKKMLGIKSTILDKTFQQISDSAGSHASKWKKLGVPGVFIFVWIPLTGTGPIVGAFLGHIIGLPYWTNLLTVLTGSISSIIAWAFFAKAVNKLFEGPWLDIISDIFIGFIIATIIIAKLKSWIGQYFKNRCRKQE